jgi:hypothetical protein
MIPTEHDSGWALQREKYVASTERPAGTLADWAMPPGKRNYFIHKTSVFISQISRVMQLREINNVYSMNFMEHEMHSVGSTLQTAHWIHQSHYQKPVDWS